MAITPLSQAVLQGMDPNIYRSLGNIQQGNAMQEAGMDATPTSKWGAIGRLANALAGSYISNSSTSDLAKTIAGGKRTAADQLMEAMQSQKRAVPTSAPAVAPVAPAVPAVPSQVMQPDPSSANTQVANRFPEEWTPSTAATPSPLDTAAWPSGPNGAPSQMAGQPRGIRNNNPLNIEAGDFTKGQPGFSGSDGRFARFETPEQGLAAAHKLLDIYDQKHGLNTVAGIVNRWAPPTDGNNTTAYAADVAGKLGIDPNQPVPKEMRPQLIAAMAQHENGVPVPGADQMPYKVAGPATAAPQSLVPDDAELPAAATPTQGQGAPTQSGGLDVHRLLAVLQNPYSDDATKSLAGKLLAAHLAPSEDTYGVTGEGPFGDKQYGFINTKEHTINGQEVAGQRAQNSGPMAGIDSTKTGDDYLKQFPPEIQANVKDYISGTKMPTGNPRRTDVVRQIASKYGAEVGLPADDTAFSERRKMRTDLGASTPNSMGGILSNGKSSFAHLADGSDRMAELGNYNGPKTVGGALMGNASNYVANTLGTPDTAAKITGIRDNLLKYGQEATKFYAGSGGGEAERMNAAKTMDPTTSSSKQMAEFLETEKGLMIDRLTQKENDVRRTLGQDYLDKHPIKTPDFEANVKRIDANIAKLGGSQSGTTAIKPEAASAASDRSAIEAEMRKRGLLQ